MERQVSHLVRLVDDLLEVSRITRGVIDLQQRAARPRARRRGRRRHQPAGRSRPARHELIGRPARREPIAVSGDAGAADAGVREPAEQRRQVHRRRRPHLAVSARRERRRGRRRRCATTASASPPTQLTSVFDMFMQVDRSNRRAQGGLGIGLTLVRSLVACTAARVEARSDGPGTGSEFVVRAAGARRAPAPTPPSTPARGERFRRGASWSSTTTATPPRRSAMLLTALGATVAVAHSGRAALDAVDDVRRPTPCCSTSACRAWTATRSPADPRAAAASRRPADRAHRLGTGGRSAAIARRGLRPPPRQAAEHRQAARAARRRLVSR